MKHALVAVCLIFAGTVNVAGAEIVTLNYVGAITSISGTVFDLDVSIGQPVTGTITYDTSLPPFLDTGDAMFYSQPSPNGMVAVIAGQTFTSPGFNNVFVAINNTSGDSIGPCGFTPGPMDNVGAFLALSQSTFSNLGFSFTDSTLTALSSTALPSPLDLLKFGLRDGCLNEFDSAGTLRGSVHFSIDPSSSSSSLVSLTSALLWIGLKNSDDQGTRFDLRAEVLVNDTLVAEGITRCVTGVTRNASRAKEVGVPFGPVSDNILDTGDRVSLKILARIGTNPDGSKCPGHGSTAGLRLYYDFVNHPSQLGAEISPDPLTDFFLHANAVIDDSPPTSAVARFQDSSRLRYSGGNPWAEIGTWTLVIP